MEIFIEKQLISVGYSFILGLIFGASYDIIRMIHILSGTMSFSAGKKQVKTGALPFVLFLITDFIYMSAVSVVFSVFVYIVNYGDFRWYLLFGAVVGFVLYHFTVGRVVAYFSDVLARAIRTVLCYTVALPLRLLLRVVKKLVMLVYCCTLGILIGRLNEMRLARRSRKYLRLTLDELSFDIKQ